MFKSGGREDKVVSLEIVFSLQHPGLLLTSHSEKIPKTLTSQETISAVTEAIMEDKETTDLTLRCLAGTLPSHRLRGLMIALCCHHRCDWGSYVGKQFLMDQGFTRADFALLVSMTSWATCGFGRGKKTGIDEEDTKDDSKVLVVLYCQTYNCGDFDQDRKEARELSEE